jgi:hypothetical protein
MHEPLSRDMRIKHDDNSTLALVRACAVAVIVAVGTVGIALITGELMAGRSDQAVAVAKVTTGSATGARDAAPSPNDLFSGMPLP